MDTGSTLVGLFLLAVCIMPFIIIGINRKKREKKMLKSLVKMANLKDCHLLKHEISLNYAIGMDEKSKNVFFISLLNGQVNESSISLSTIRSSSVKTAHRTVGEKKNKYDVIDKIELVLMPHDKNKSDIFLEFYNADNNRSLFNELQSAEKWSAQIKKNIKNK